MNYLVSVEESTGRVVNIQIEPAVLPSGVEIGLKDGIITMIVGDSVVGSLQPHEFVHRYRYLDETWIDYGVPPGRYAALVGGVWVTDEGPLLQEIRSHRNFLLAETDYTHLSDAPHTPEEIEEFRVYRQALRDLTKGLDLTGKYDISDVTFPTKP